MANNYALKLQEMQDKLMPPPRPVPLPLQLGNYFGGLWNTLGWSAAALGLLILILNLTFETGISAGILIASAILLAGVVMIYVGVKKGRLNNYLLANGIISGGKLIKRESTNTRINNRPVFKLVYEYTADDGKEYETTIKTHRVDRFQKGVAEPIIYFPGYGDVSTVLRNMPSYPVLGEAGTFQPAGLMSQTGNFFRLILPAATLIFGTAYLLDWLGIMPLPPFLDVHLMLYDLLGSDGTTAY